MIDVVQIGKRRTFLVPQTISKIGYLNCLYTDYSSISNIKKRFFWDILFISYQDELLKNVNANQIKNVSYGLRYYIKRYFIKNKYELDTLYFSAIRRFLLNVIKLMKKKEATILYAFNGVSLELFQSTSSMKKVYDMTSLMPLDEYNILREEFEEFGYLEDQSFEQNIEGAEKMHNRQLKEIEYADVVICLSENVANSIKKHMGVEKKIKVIHHPVNINPQYKIYKSKVKKIFFLGRVSVDKGIHYLLKYVDEHNIDNLIIDIIGPIHLNTECTKKYSTKINFLGMKSSTEILKNINSYDLMVFPSVVGGLGMACYESMANGVVVLTTENEVIKDGFHGFTYRDRDYTSFKKRLNEILSYAPDYLSEVSVNAKELMEKHNIDNYGVKLKEVFDEILKNK